MSVTAVLCWQLLTCHWHWLDSVLVSLCTSCRPSLSLQPKHHHLEIPMAFSFFLHLSRYFLFGMSSHQPYPARTNAPMLFPQAITVISDAIICSAAAWNLPIAKNTKLHSRMAHSPKITPYSPTDDPSPTTGGYLHDLSWCF